MPEPSSLRLALSPDEAATALGCSRDFLDEHIGPELRWVRRGRRKFVAIKELERWLDRNATVPLCEELRADRRLRLPG
jgi:hypothetical protein